MSVKQAFQTPPPQKLSEDSTSFDPWNLHLLVFGGNVKFQRTRGNPLAKEWVTTILRRMLRVLCWEKLKCDSVFSWPISCLNSKLVVLQTTPLNACILGCGKASWVFEAQDVVTWTKLPPGNAVEAWLVVFEFNPRFFPFLSCHRIFGVLFHDWVRLSSNISNDRMQFYRVSERSIIVGARQVSAGTDVSRFRFLAFVSPHDIVRVDRRNLARETKY